MAATEVGCEHYVRSCLLKVSDISFHVTVIRCISYMVANVNKLA